MSGSETPLILALETSCDETAVAISRGTEEILASEIASQITLHRPYGGVVPELASRNHITNVRPLVEAACRRAEVSIADIDAFAATAGPGLASSLLVGNTVAKSLAISTGKPFLAINHLEGHLLSPFIDRPDGVRPCIALVVSGGHTSLIHVRATGDYHQLGTTRDDAAGEAFDKVAKMLGLPYPGGPEIDRLAGGGDRGAFAFPRSMMRNQDFDFSFSGLKTAVLYQLPKLGERRDERLADVCASFQEAVVEVLVDKTLRAARSVGADRIAVSGGVSCNSRLREAFRDAGRESSIEVLIASSQLSTDNAAMIAYVAALKLLAGQSSALDTDVDPNLQLARARP